MHGVVRQDERSRDFLSFPGSVKIDHLVDEASMHAGALAALSLKTFEICMDLLDQLGNKQLCWYIWSVWSKRSGVWERRAASLMPWPLWYGRTTPALKQSSTL